MRHRCWGPFCMWRTCVRHRYCWHVRDPLPRLCVQLLGADAKESAWNFCAPAVDYDALRKEVSGVFAEKSSEVQRLVAKLHKTQRAAEKALDKRDWAWGFCSLSCIPECGAVSPGMRRAAQPSCGSAHAMRLDAAMTRVQGSRSPEEIHERLERYSLACAACDLTLNLSCSGCRKHTARCVPCFVACLCWPVKLQRSSPWSRW